MSKPIEEMVKQAEDAELFAIAAKLEEQESQIADFKNKVENAEDAEIQAYKEGYNEGAAIDPYALTDLFFRLDILTTISETEFVDEIRKMHHSWESERF